MKSFVRIFTAILLAVCITAIPSAEVFAAGSAQSTEQSKVTPDPREITVSAANTGQWTQKSDKKWYYYEDGKPCIGWHLIGGRMYYLDPAKNGARVTGFQQIAINGTKHTFYFSDSNYLKYSSSNAGQMLTGF